MIFVLNWDYMNKLNWISSLSKVNPASPPSIAGDGLFEWLDGWTNLVDLQFYQTFSIFGYLSNTFFSSDKT